MGLPTRVLRGLAAVACATALTGCYTLSFNVDDIYGSAQPKPQTIRSFKLEVKHHHLFSGLLTISNSAEIAEAVAREVKRAGGRAAANVRITHQETLLDGLIGSLTGGTLYVPTTSTVEGDVVR
ncbi:MAG: hypothetical protein VKP62_14170 [Candidatus Sericytochromatia bacterium]|nr:hypothetical protein [Candidatus Sericytochromatia bacterium]